MAQVSSVTWLGAGGEWDSLMSLGDPGWGCTGQIPAHGRDDTLQPREAAGQPQRTPLQQNKQPKARSFCQKQSGNSLDLQECSPAPHVPIRKSSKHELCSARSSGS